MSNFNFEDFNNQIKQDFQAADDCESLEALRVKYLGRKGILAELTSRISTLPVEQKPKFGQQVNRIKQQVVRLLEEGQKNLQVGAVPRAAKSKLDITLPGMAQSLGHKHLITQTMEEICDIFAHLGFIIIEGPEIETEYNNFTALNIPLEHPSRDAFDTFYLESQSHPSTSSFGTSTKLSASRLRTSLGTSKVR